MKTKIWVGVLFYSFMGCANKAPKSNLTSKSIPKEPEGMVSVYSRARRTGRREYGL